MTKNNLTSKLRAYTALTASGMLMSTANAGIVYTDIDPDSVRVGNDNATSEYFYIDLDLNGVDDFQIGMFNAQMNSMRTYTWNGVWASGINTSSLASTSNAIAYSGAAFSYKLTLPLSAGSTIGASRSFSYYNLLGAVSYWSTVSSNGGNGYFGNFTNQGEKYMGLRFTVGGNIHYGWARVQVDSANYGFTLMDYAYETCPNTSIQAGMMTGGSGINMYTLTACDAAIIGGITYTSSQIVYDTISTGTCDSVDIVDLVVNYTERLDSIIEGCDSVFFNGTTYTTDTILSDTIIGVTTSGCDSIITNEIRVHTTNTFSQTIYGCDSTTYNSIIYTTDTTFTETLVGGAMNGCDSIVATQIMINNTASTNQNLSINEGDSIMLGGSSQTTAGTYVDSLLTVNGCDSIVTTVLSVIPADGLHENERFHINLFPNPSSGIYHLDLSSLHTQTANIVLTDHTGKMIYAANMINTSKLQQINLENHPKGLYFLKIQSDKISTVVKLILQ